MTPLLFENVWKWTSFKNRLIQIQKELNVLTMLTLRDKVKWKINGVHIAFALSVRPFFVHHAYIVPRYHQIS